jgi:hypothetical protein
MANQPHSITPLNKKKHPRFGRQKAGRGTLKHFYPLMYSSAGCVCVLDSSVSYEVWERDGGTIFLVADFRWRQQQLRLCLANASNNSSFIARVSYPGFYFMAAQHQPRETIILFFLLREFPQDCFARDLSQMWNGKRGLQHLVDTAVCVYIRWVSWLIL